MTEPKEDPYETPYVPNPIGEIVPTFHPDGSVTIVKRSPAETSSIWKGARRIYAIPHENISVILERPSGIIDYSIDGTRVSWGHGKKKRGYLCHRHKANRCACTERVKRWRLDHAR